MILLYCTICLIPYLSWRRHNHPENTIPCRWSGYNLIDIKNRIWLRWFETIRILYIHDMIKVWSPSNLNDISWNRFIGDKWSLIISMRLKRGTHLVLLLNLTGERSFWFYTYTKNVRLHCNRTFIICYFPMGISLSAQFPCNPWNTYTFFWNPWPHSSILVLNCNNRTCSLSLYIRSCPYLNYCSMMYNTATRGAMQASTKRHNDHPQKSLSAMLNTITQSVSNTQTNKCFNDFPI